MINLVLIDFKNKHSMKLKYHSLNDSLKFLKSYSITLDDLATLDEEKELIFDDLHIYII